MNFVSSHSSDLWNLDMNSYPSVANVMERGTFGGVALWIVVLPVLRDAPPSLTSIDEGQGQGIVRKN